MSAISLVSTVNSCCVGGVELIQFLDQGSLIYSSTEIGSPKIWVGKMTLRVPRGKFNLDTLDTTKSNLLSPGRNVDFGVRNSDGGTELLRRLKIETARYDPVTKAVEIEMGCSLKLLQDAAVDLGATSESGLDFRFNYLRQISSSQVRALVDVDPYFEARLFELLTDERIATGTWNQDGSFIDQMAEIASVGDVILTTNKYNEITVDRLWSGTPPQDRFAYALQLEDVADFKLSSSAGRVPRSVTSQGVVNDTEDDEVGLPASGAYGFLIAGERKRANASAYSAGTDYGQSITLYRQTGSFTAGASGSIFQVLRTFDVLVPRSAILYDTGNFRVPGWDRDYRRGFGYIHDGTLTDIQLDEEVIVEQWTWTRRYSVATNELVEEEKIRLIARCMLPYHYAGGTPSILDADQLALVPGTRDRNVFSFTGQFHDGKAQNFYRESDAGEGKLVLTNGGHRRVRPSDIPNILLGTETTVVVGGTAAPLEGEPGVDTITDDLPVTRADAGVKPTTCVREVDGFTCSGSVVGLTPATAPATVDTDQAYTLDQHRRAACQAAHWLVWQGQRYEATINISEDHKRNPERYWWGGVVIDDTAYVIDSVRYEIRKDFMACVQELCVIGKTDQPAPASFTQAPVFPDGGAAALVPNLTVNALLNVPFNSFHLPLLNVVPDYASDIITANVISYEEPRNIYLGGGDLVYGAPVVTDLLEPFVFVDTASVGRVAIQAVDWTVTPIFEVT